MKKAKRFLSLLLVAAMVFTVMTGCGKKEQAKTGSETKEKTLKDTLTVATFEEPTTLDPASTNRNGISLVHSAIMEKLLVYNMDGTFTPVLAESWEWKDDLNLVFHLRKNVKFSNGSPFTAKDVLYTYKRAKANPISTSMFAAFDTENSFAVDDYTVNIRFLKPYAMALNVIAGLKAGICTESQPTADVDRKPIGTGPYALKEWVTGSEIRMVRNENYWGEKPAMKNLVFKIIPEAASRVIELETGGSDIALKIQANDVKRVSEIPGVKVVPSESYRYVYVTFSMKDELTGNEDFRKALSYAIDKEALVKASYNESATVCTGMYNKNIWAFEELGTMPYDLAKAKEYLAKAGYPNGVEVNMTVDPDNEFTKLAEGLQNMWAQIGVKLNINVINNNTFKGQGGHYQIAIRDGTNAEPSTVLIVYESSFADRIQGNDTWLDEQLLKARTIMNDKEREQFYKDVNKYIYEKRYAIPLADTPSIMGVTDKVEGLKTDPEFYLNWNQIKAYK
jgi:peptide/nickel transport system substrate-binding protein